jgi:hypothetical protein
MKRDSSIASASEAEIIALNALGFLAAEPDRLRRFMDLSGLGLDAIRTSAADPAFLGAVLDHLLADESLLLVFAADHDISPERILTLRRKLPGAALDL